MSSSSSTKNHSKKKECGRERDRLKATASESGGSSQCDTPPLIERDGTTAQGRYAGIGADSVQCIADQVGAEMSTEAATNLAEDISYKLRQIISSIALHSEMMKKTSVDSWDANTAFTLADTGPVVGATATHYVQLGDEKLFCPVEELINVNEFALMPQTFVYASHPTLSVEWITDEKSLNSKTNISVNLQNYYTKVARAILNLRKKPKEVAVADLMTNTRIGPIFPNLFNLAVLVLNDDNLYALNVPAKKPLQSNVLDMVDALCSNPCSLDTNIQQQFQRLFPVMVSSILGKGPLSEKMVTILTKIMRTWPPFILIGKGILFDYLAQGTKERLTAPMIKCLMALGRQALIECLGGYLEYLDDCIHATRRNVKQANLREAILEVSTYLLRSEPTTYLEDFVTTDYTLYEMLGDSILPRRTIFPKKEKNSLRDLTNDKNSEEEITYNRPLRRPKLRHISTLLPLHNGYKETAFETTRFRRDRCIRIKIRNCRTLHVAPKILQSPAGYSSHSSPNTGVCDRGVVVAGGLLHRFKYKIRREWQPAPYYAAMLL